MNHVLSFTHLGFVCSLSAFLSSCAAYDSFDNYRTDLHSAVEKVSDVDPRKGKTRLSNERLDESYRDVIGACAKVVNLMESRSDGRRTRTIAIAIVGTLAGTVAAPAVIARDGSMALSAGLSGLAGASNAAQQLFDEEGYTRRELIVARENMINEINGYVAQWLRLEGVADDPSDKEGTRKLNAKLGIINGLIAACSFYQLTAAELSDEAAMVVDEALSQESSKGGATGGNGDQAGGGSAGRGKTSGGTDDGEDGGGGGSGDPDDIGASGAVTPGGEERSPNDAADN